ncbi:hypothetical protein GWN26_03255 [Candidatus Saccharibacteria bacterium]|nr:hypothetical protein [Calditrichia bacterium]NIV71590.1 hypothetical protein [Calditrichia bacterium]NIV98203.1 hypothetical protein [Candidatus Saccharibacteria bacterium]NIW78478.1 hypothetical protein [Calditrichia bacterium]
MIEYLRFAWTAFKANKIRFFLTTLGVFIGVTTIIIIFTIIQSINEYIADEVAAFGTTTIYIDKFPWVITENYFEYRNRPPITLKEYEALDRNVTYTHWISPIAGYRRNVKYRNERLERVLVTGCNERYPETNNVVADIGRWFTASEVRSARLVCVIGRNIWDELFRKQDAVGKRLKINGYPYRVIGIMEKKGNLFGFNMDNQIIVPYTAMRGYAYTWRGISIAMKVDRPAKLEGLKHEAQGILRRVRKVSPQEEDNFAINQQNMLTDFYNQITGTAYIVIFLIGAVSLVVGGIGMAL